MTNLIDVKAPRYEVSETLVLHVDAGPDEVLAAVDAIREPHAGVQVLGRADGERLFGMTWRPLPGLRVEIVWDIRADSDGEGGTALSSTRRFVASDEETRDSLRASWSYIRATAHTIARQTLRGIKRTAEERPLLARLELALAA